LRERTGDCTGATRQPSRDLPGMWRRQPEIDALLTRIRQMVSERDRRRRAGAAREELARRSAEIGRLHSQLADDVRRGLREENARHGTQA
jgi:hypothetical protein